MTSDDQRIDTGRITAIGARRPESPLPSDAGKDDAVRARTFPAIPEISLPKGGGALRSIGEKLTPNPATGVGSLNIPLAISPGRSGVTPSLSLSYEAGFGNGPFGLGWRLSLPSIRRKTEKGLPTYRDSEDADIFLLSDAEDLVPLRKFDGGGWSRDVVHDGTLTFIRYRPRVESAFARIERIIDDSGDSYWRTISRENVINIFGRDPSARIADPAGSLRVFEWYLETTIDDRGNVIVYEYKSEDAAGVDSGAAHEQHRLSGLSQPVQRYLKRVRYGNRVAFAGDLAAVIAGGFLFTLVFDFGDHDADRPRIEEDGAWLVRADPFSTYRATFEVRTYRLCRRVLMFHDFPALGDEPCLVRSTDFSYDENGAHTLLIAAQQSGAIRNGAAYTKQSTPAIEMTYTAPVIDPSIHVADAENLPVGIDEALYRWTDLDGEGLSGILTEQGDEWWYERNRGNGSFDPPRLVATRPSTADLAGGRQQLLDLTGGGQMCLVRYDGVTPGFYERADDDWSPFRPFPNRPNVDWNDPRLRFVDLDGDGHADVLITDDQVFTFFRSLTTDGFADARRVATPADEERGPHVVLADGTETVFVADMSGDGLQDLVRVRDGEVCYWPSLGFGRFGARVTMSNAPRFGSDDEFDPRRVRLADIDGSGTTDLLYLGRIGVSMWINEAGNRWSDEIVVSGLPVDSLASVRVIDLLGNGTACLVWSSPAPLERRAPLRYVNLLSDGKPYLLATFRNNVGAETTLHYQPSTAFFLADRRAGRPWSTRLPFPVHMVDRIDKIDRVTGLHTITRFAFHDGYFDPMEREFRGFGRVEQWDADEFTAGGPDADQAPVRTVSWFHTGAPSSADALRAAIDRDAWSEAGGPQPWRTHTIAMPALASASEDRQAARALKGKLLRQEVFADDDSPEAANPYTAVEHTYDVKLLQPADGDLFAAFTVCDRETFNCVYDRVPSDPRVSHTLTLDVDPFGNVTRAAEIAYERRVPAPDSFDEQSRAWMTLTTSTFVNVDDQPWRRIGVPVETRKYELTGAPRAAGAPVTFDALHDTVPVDIAFEATPSGAFERRLISAKRTLYWRDDLAGALPLGAIESRALLFETHEAAFTTGLVAQAFGTRATDAILMNEGRYFRWAGESDGLWWSPSGRTEYDAASFFLPIAFVTPAGARSSVAYDAHALFIAAAHDALPAPFTNTRLFAHHYRTLSPWRITDANGNRNAARFDALGRVIATAVIDKDGHGDTLDEASLESAAADAPTATLEYHVEVVPAYVVTRKRERHHDASTRWFTSIEWSDGSGNVVLNKTQAEPGLAPFRGNDGHLVRVNGHPVLQPTTDRWVGSGKVVLNNKGNPVKKYEPYFIAGAGFDDEDDLVAHGVTPLLRYDPIGRVTRVDQPDGTLTRTESSPWQENAFDENDTVLDSAWYAERLPLGAADPEGHAALLASAHANTPRRSSFDALGRRCVTFDLSAAAITHVTRMQFDVDGNTVGIVDPRGIPTFAQTFDMLGRVIVSVSGDAGTRRTLQDAHDHPIRSWEGEGASERAHRRSYDENERPSEHFANGVLVEKWQYGERHADAVARNLRRCLFRHYDGAGTLTNARYDFDGNLVEGARVVAADGSAPLDWSTLVGLDDIDATAVAAAPLLSDETFTTTSSFDALGHVIRGTHPDGSIVLPAYNERGLLDSVAAQLRGGAETTPFVTGASYDARAQRQSIDYGNGVTTTYTYDAANFRLRSLTSRKAAQTLQDLHYTYDAVGNVVEIRDDAQQTVYFANAVAEPRTRYEYDALYRLTTAEGRELTATSQPPMPDPFPAQPLPHVNDAAALRRYTRTHAYDLSGNITSVVHRSGGVNLWSRFYTYAADSNRLASFSLPGDPAAGPYSGNCTHDTFGNITVMPHLPSLTWGTRDELAEVSLGGGGTAHYAYDGARSRVRSFVARIDGVSVERIYASGAYEIYRERSGAGVSFERQTLHITDGDRRIAIIETNTVSEGAPVAAPNAVIRHQLADHLQSSCVETNGSGVVISYEEFYPYGATSYFSARSGVSTKRYRYIGRERDADTGFDCCGVRYYASWIGRWISADPAGRLDGTNLYRYCRDNPIGLNDPAGTTPNDPNQPVTQPTTQPVAQPNPTPPPPPPNQPTAPPTAADIQATAQNTGFSNPGPLPYQPVGTQTSEFTGTAAPIGPSPQVGLLYHYRYRLESAEVGLQAGYGGAGSPLASTGILAPTLHIGQQAIPHVPVQNLVGGYVLGGLIWGQGAPFHAPGAGRTGSDQNFVVSGLAAYSHIRDEAVQIDVNLAAGYQRFGQINGVDVASFVNPSIALNIAFPFGLNIEAAQALNIGAGGVVADPTTVLRNPTISTPLSATTTFGIGYGHTVFDDYYLGGEIYVQSEWGATVATATGGGLGGSFFGAPSGGLRLTLSAINRPRHSQIDENFH